MTLATKKFIAYCIIAILLTPCIMMFNTDGAVIINLIGVAYFAGIVWLFRKLMSPKTIKVLFGDYPDNV